MGWPPSEERGARHPSANAIALESVASVDA